MVSRCAVIGNPVAHSLSPLIHQYFAKEAGNKLIYEKIQGHDTDFETQVIGFFKEGGKGLNVTLPFKERAFAMADDVTPRCLKAKSANTLWLKNEEKLCADNTDGTGLIRDLSHHLSLIDKRVLLLGAGGAARGIIEPLLASGITKLTLINRTKEKLFILKNDFPAIEIADQDTLKARFDLIINATSASLTASQNKLISAKILQNQPYCYDLAYNLHKQTPFVAFARAHGCVADDGLGMLVEQAAEAFLIWHGFKPDTNTVLTALQR